MGLVLAGPAVAAAASAALRSWLPRDSAILSLPGVLVELGHSPVFYLSLVFAVSWSLLGLQVRAPGPRAGSDRWSSLPLLFWALLGNRHQAFYYDGSGLHDFPPPVRSEILWAGFFVLPISLAVTVAATLPTLLQDRRHRQRVGIDLVALLPVAVVLVDWTIFASILTTLWLREGG